MYVYVYVTAGFNSVLRVSAQLLVPSSGRAVHERLPVWDRDQRTSGVQSTGTERPPSPPFILCS